MIEKTKRTAKEMFEEMGFIKSKDKDEKRHLSFYKGKYADEEVIFYLKDKDCEIRYENIISVELHKAIHQQFRELGWLNDKKNNG